MAIASAVYRSTIRPLAWLAPAFAFSGGCLPAASSTPAAESPASAVAEPPAEAAPSPEEAAQADAKQRAQAWLALVDGGQYDASWEAAAPVFQSSTTKEQWNQALQGARGPLGALGSRELRAAEYKTAIEGAPDGKYVVVYYDSSFARKSGAREIVTLRQQLDESWKVAGYFVQ